MVRVFLSNSLSSLTGIFFASSVISPSNSGRSHLAMSSKIFDAGLSSPVSSASNVQSSWRFVWNTLAFILTFVETRFPALASLRRFRNCGTALVVPDILITALDNVSIPSRLIHLSRSSSWYLGCSISNISISGSLSRPVAQSSIVVISVFLLHLHGHERHSLHRCPLGSVRLRLPASSGSKSCASELIIALEGGFSGAYTWPCWMRTHVPRFTPSIIVFSNRDWFSGSTTPVFLWMFSYNVLVVVSVAWWGHASVFT